MKISDASNLPLMAHTQAFQILQSRWKHELGDCEVNAVMGCVE